MQRIQNEELRLIWLYFANGPSLQCWIQHFVEITKDSGYIVGIRHDKACEIVSRSAKLDIMEAAILSSKRTSTQKSHRFWRLFGLFHCIEKRPRRAEFKQIGHLHRSRRRT